MIKEAVQGILRELPSHVHLVAAAKGQSAEQIQQALEGGVKIIGENYIQEAERAFRAIGHKVKWHFIGHLQTNKVKKAVKLFDMIETVDSKQLAIGLDNVCAGEDIVMPVLVEINSAGEQQKFGVMPEQAEGLIRELSSLTNVKIMGLMTMGPYSGDPELARPYFIRTKKLFERIGNLNLGTVEMKYLSMGMSNSYRIAIEEGANIVRIGSKIFGAREPQMKR
jgi:pyridoxal phosphate enzyme (YggS family)